MEKLKENQFIPVGEMIQVGLKTFKVIESKNGLSCKKCSLFGSQLCYIFRDYILGDCAAENRPDKKEVYFVECKE